jgi:hypothetical protein
VRRLNGYLAGAAQGLLVCTLLAAPAFATEGEPEQAAPAVPPGQEALLLEMLGKGAALPDGCKLAAGEVDHTVIEATYDCAFGKVILELAHPREARPTDEQTEQFVFTVLEGSPPDSLVDAVGALIHAHEDDFEWAWPAREPAENPATDAGDGL